MAWTWTTTLASGRRLTVRYTGAVLKTVVRVKFSVLFYGRRHRIASIVVPLREYRHLIAWASRQTGRFVVPVSIDGVRIWPGIKRGPIMIVIDPDDALELLAEEGDNP